MSDLGQAFLDHSRALLLEDYLPKVEHCVASMDEAQLWWRPGGQSNAAGNLLMHLAGNVRQWIIHGIGGALCIRDRASEFAADGGADRTTLLRRLRRTCEEAGAVLSGLGSGSLLERRRIQGLDVSVMGAVYHVTEHFAGHTGQIIYITKLTTGRDLGFWVIGDDGAVQRGWTSG